MSTVRFTSVVSLQHLINRSLCNSYALFNKNANCPKHFIKLYKTNEEFVLQNSYNPVDILQLQQFKTT